MHMASHCSYPAFHDIPHDVWWRICLHTFFWAMCGRNLVSSVKKSRAEENAMIGCLWVLHNKSDVINQMASLAVAHSLLPYINHTGWVAVQCTAQVAKSPVEWSIVQFLVYDCKHALHSLGCSKLIFVWFDVRQHLGDKVLVVNRSKPCWSSDTVILIAVLAVWIHYWTSWWWIPRSTIIF